jgi:hypothetical protein
VVFVILFVALALALPLSLEIARKGGDNVLSRSVREVAESNLAQSLNATMQGWARKLDSPQNFALDSVVGGTLSLLVLAVAVWMLAEFPVVVTKFIYVVR